MLRIQYMVHEIEPAVEFYTKYLGFKTKMKNAPYFAMLTRDDVDLALSTPYGPGRAEKPMNDRTKPEAGLGWNRMIITVDDLEAGSKGCVRRTYIFETKLRPGRAARR